MGKELCAAGGIRGEGARLEQRPYACMDWLRGRVTGIVTKRWEPGNLPW